MIYKSKNRSVNGPSFRLVSYRQTLCYNNILPSYTIYGCKT